MLACYFARVVANTLCDIGFASQGLRFCVTHILGMGVPMTWDSVELWIKSHILSEPPFQISDFGDITKFKTRLSSLRKIVKQKSEQAEEDALALAHDQLIFPEPILDIRGYPNWRKSEARKQLKKDLTEGKHKNRRPMVLWLSHPEYQKFPLTVFRNHIYKELRKMKKGGRKKHGVRSK